MSARKGLRPLSYFIREKWLHVVLVAVLAIVFGRLIWLQTVVAADLKARGLEQRTAGQAQIPARGTIFDAQGDVLAQSVPVKEVYADPNGLSQMIANHQYKGTKQEVAAKLSSILGIDTNDILDKLNRNAVWVSLAHQVELAKVDQIATLKIPGVGFNDEEKRIYPMDNLAASVLGIVNMTGHGVEGVESYYDKYLYGMPGYAGNDTNTPNGAGQDDATPVRWVQRGDDLTLTLDATIQHLVEEQLDDIVTETKPKNAVILAMDPTTGKILGMGSRPNFNPNNYTAFSADDRRPLAISMNYEPGSTFKPVTGSAALEEGAVTPDERFPDPGYLQVGPGVITNWDSDQNPHGNPTFTEGMKLSSNVVLAQVGMKLGINNFYTYLKGFGFGNKSGVDITGEESGLLVPKDQVKPIELATMSFGQANLVTPIQLLDAICVVANGGTLFRPYVVEKVTDPNSKIVLQNKPTALRQVISKATAAQMTKILVQVVADGTGALARIPGIEIAGKTGTAQKVDPKTGLYSKTDFIASFTAYAPAGDPKIAVLIVIDSPQGSSHQGGTIGAPRAKAILEGALRYYGVPVNKDTQSTVTISPNDPPIRPVPKPVVPERTPMTGEAVVPDLTGLTMRQAGEVLLKLELHFNFTGTGLVIQQNPLPGKMVPKGSVVDVKFVPLGQSP